MLRIVCFFSLSLFLFGIQQTQAQETTASLSGTVTDIQKLPVAGASVIVKHEPTGYSTGTQTNNKGIFVIPNLKPGGPYTLIISFTGYREQKMENLQLTLGDNPGNTITLQVAGNNLQEVVITATGKAHAAGLVVGRTQLTTLPTLGRSLSDFTRLTPQSNNNSFAGTNFRYNNITLDGAVNNDAIGFSNSFGGVSGGGQSGTSGSGSRTNPYSLDAIQEVQVQLAPYDVKLGNFTGGSVNAVTKSGTNELHGSVYGFGRNQALVGKSVDGLKSSIGSQFHDYQYGASLGGPIIKNKLFFFVNGEITRRQEPTFYNAGDPGAAIDIPTAKAITDFMKTRYNYDPGTYGAYTIATSSDKLFGRIDWNINSRNSLMLRAIYTNGYGQNLERTSTNFQFSSTDFTQHDKNLNLAAELKTKFNNNLSNNLILTYVNVHEYRDFPGALSPFVDIGSGKVWLGTWREASVYNMRQKTFEVTDNITWTKGIHKFTFGTHDEFYNLTYGFINSWNGRIEYADTSKFFKDQPARIRGAFTYDNAKNNRDDLYNNPTGQFNVNLLSAYAQDEITLKRNFKITPGFRIDYPFVNKQPALDPAVTGTKEYISANPTFTHTPWADLNNKWLGQVTVSPRLGFNYDIKGDQSLVLRGGTGIFVGRMPFAWLGYAYTLTGTTYGNIDYKPANNQAVPLAIDPTHLKDTVTKYGGTAAANTREVDIIDNHFKLPAIWRSSLALDIKFARVYKLTLDAMYTKTIWDVKFQQINIKDTSAYFSSGPNQSPVYLGGKMNNDFSNVYFLTNTKEGYRYNFTVQLSKANTRLRLNHHSLITSWMAAYTYGLSKDVSNGIRNSFQSNYELNPAVVPGNAQLAYSNFDMRHRIVANASLGLQWNEHQATSLAFFFSAQSGSPYSFIYSSSPNPFNNASNANLIFIPKDQSQINLADVKDGNGNITYSAAQQWTDLDRFINNDSYLKKHRGEYAARNGARTPWNSELDLKLMHEFKFGKSHSIQVSFDVFNFLNMLNNDWGHITFVTNVNNYTANLLKFVNDANGVAPGKGNYVPTLNFNKPPATGHYYTVDPISSRWQGQLGVRYSF